MQRNLRTVESKIALSRRFIAEVPLRGSYGEISAGGVLTPMPSRDRGTDGRHKSECNRRRDPMKMALLEALVLLFVKQAEFAHRKRVAIVPTAGMNHRHVD